MVLLESSMIQLGTQAPDFSLHNAVNQEQQTLEMLQGAKGTLIVFMCNHCPFVVHILEALIDSARQIQRQGIETIAISSNSVKTHPQDGPKPMQAMAQQKNFSFPYLYDESQETARAYQATCTPDLFLFDGALHLYYRGRYDDSTPGNNQSVSGADLHAACDALLAGEVSPETQYPSMGCSIKWES